MNQILKSDEDKKELTESKIRKPREAAVWTVYSR
jgi:hypothetical protein